MKRVFLKSRFKGITLHRMYDILIKYPPENYKIIPSYKFKNARLSTSISKYRNKFYKQIVYHFGSLPYVIYQLRETKMDVDEYDLVYLSQHVLDLDKPWIVDLEYSNGLSGYLNISFSKNVISKRLKSENCKAIIPWSQWARETLIKSMDCKDFKNKIKVIRYTVPPKEIKPKKRNDKIKILFLGTINPGNVYSYEFKGLFETFDAFVDLQKKYDNIELIIRSAVPQDLKKKARKYSNIKVIENELSDSEIEYLFQTSDIFSRTGYEALNLSVLEAMSYGIPVIATSLFNIPEAINHMKNGLLIDPLNSKDFYTKYKTPNDFSGSFTKAIRSSRPLITKKLKEGMKLLIEDASLRNRLGKEALNTINDGEFSLKKRNSLLKEVFDEATQN